MLIFAFTDSSVGQPPEQRMITLQNPELTLQASPVRLQRITLKGKPSQQLRPCHPLPGTAQEPDGHVEAMRALCQQTQPPLQLHNTTLSDQLPSTSESSLRIESSSTDESSTGGTSSTEKVKDYIKTSIAVKRVRVAGKGIKRKHGNMREGPSRKVCRVEQVDYRKELTENMIETSKMMMNTMGTEVSKSIAKGAETLTTEVSRSLEKCLGKTSETVVTEMSKSIERGFEKIVTAIDQLGDKLVGCLHMLASANNQ